MALRMRIRLRDELVLVIKSPYKDVDWRILFSTHLHPHTRRCGCGRTNCHQSYPKKSRSCHSIWQDQCLDLHSLGREVVACRALEFARVLCLQCLQRRHRIFLQWIHCPVCSHAAVHYINQPNRKCHNTTKRYWIFKNTPLLEALRRTEEKLLKSENVSILNGRK